MIGVLVKEKNRVFCTRDIDHGCVVSRCKYIAKAGENIATSRSMVLVERLCTHRAGGSDVLALNRGQSWLFERHVFDIARNLDIIPPCRYGKEVLNAPWTTKEDL